MSKKDIGGMIVESMRPTRRLRGRYVAVAVGVLLALVIAVGHFRSPLAVLRPPVDSLPSATTLATRLDQADVRVAMAYVRQVWVRGDCHVSRRIWSGFASEDLCHEVHLNYQGTPAFVSQPRTVRRCVSRDTFLRMPFPGVDKKTTAAEERAACVEFFLGYRSGDSASRQQLVVYLTDEQPRRVFEARGVTLTCRAHCGSWIRSRSLSDKQ